jgi:hypothetical protein
MICTNGKNVSFKCSLIRLGPYEVRGLFYNAANNKTYYMPHQYAPSLITQLIVCPNGIAVGLSNFFNYLSTADQ